ncbi:MAG: hypothetical protein ACSHX0_04910 [Akkermansiaceae bacterium]
MKKTISLFLLSASLLCADESDYVNFIVETHTVNVEGVDVITKHHMDDLASAGTRTALEGVYGSALYSLYTLKNTDIEAILLNEASSDAFMPAIDAIITSPDSFTYSDGSKKTRVDMGYSFELVVSNISTAATTLGTKTVSQVHEAYSYAEDTLTVEGSALFTLENTFTANGAYPYTYTPNTTIAGEEIYTIYANTNPETQLDVKKIKIFPTSNGSFTGFDDDSLNVQAEVYAAVPPLLVTVTNVYPGSEIYLQYYSGAYDNNPNGAEKIVTSIRGVADTDTPYTNSYEQNELDKAIVDEGTFTLELIEKTPFAAPDDVIIHDYMTFVKEHMVINANIVGSE